MCGIIGYTGTKDAVPILVEGLRALEYRGYDSAGVALSDKEGRQIVKTKGRIDLLADKLSAAVKETRSCGIGHTRWATHGEPSDVNAHPHSTEKLALVHNGIIENYAEIEKRLKLSGYTFESETDTEAAAKLVDFYYTLSKDPVGSLYAAAADMRGSFAFGVIYADYPEVIYSMRRDSPLIVANSESGALIASDIPAILPHTNHYYRLAEGVVAIVAKDGIKFVNKKGEEIEQPEETVDWDVAEAQKSGYPHFMLKEIFEEPESIRKTVTPRLENGLPVFPSLPEKIDTIHIVACGTAMHAGLIGKTLIERMARIPVNVEIASEFRYRNPILRENDLVLLLSQSGETADTIAALRQAKANGIKTLAIVNVIGSSIAREADDVLYTMAGPEIAVASTKAYSVQCALLSLLAIRLAINEGKLDEKEAARLAAKLTDEIPTAVSKILDMSEKIRKITKQYIGGEHLFYIGRGIDCDLCTEGSLKLKEISYIHSEAYASGELKHGTISLVTEGVPVIALLTESKLAEKTISGIREVRSRGAHTLVIATEQIANSFSIPCDDMIIVPQTEDEVFELFPAVTVLQLFAYHASAQKGLDVDKPRNLAKSVTVE